MKSNLLLIASLFLFSTAWGQDCNSATALVDLDVNNVKAQLAVSGQLWNDGNYVAPNPGNGAPGVSAFFSSGFWLAGVDPGGDLRLSATTYNGGHAAGPLSDTGTTTQDDCNNFDRFWITTSEDINLFLSDWSDNQQIDNAIPESIRAWPGRGNPEFESIHGFSLPSNAQGMAPFWDENGNGVYNPMEGDYPDIKNATKGVWWVFNTLDNTEDNPLGFEVQVLAYAYASTEETLNNTTFYDYKMINRSIYPLDSMFAAIWLDPDLGCHTDDYIGSIPAHDMGYVYNMDEIDGDDNCSCPFGINTYCEDIPIVGVKILEGVKALEGNDVVDRGMSSFMAYNNGGVNPAPPPGTEDPSTATEYYNYMNGVWRDGIPLGFGGDGHNPFSTEYSDYAFPNSPHEKDGWSMCSEGLPPGDRRMVISSGPFSIEPGAVNTLCYAVIYTDNVTYPCPDISPLEDAAEIVEDFYEDFVLSTEELAENQSAVRIYPNPMIGEESILEFLDLSTPITEVQIFSIDGKLVQTYEGTVNNTLSIQRGNLNAGLYFYKAVTQNRQLYTGKFIIQ